jgi:Tol biopolymer transport system component
MRQQAGRLGWFIMAVLVTVATTPNVGKAQTTTMVVVDPAGGEINGISRHPSLSADGRYVAFEFWAQDLTSQEEVWKSNIFVYDRETETTSRVSVDPLGGDFEVQRYNPALSADGRFVAFEFWAADPESKEGNGKSGILLFDRKTEATTRVSVDSQGRDPNGYGYHPALSADGRYVAFEFSPDLLSVDGNRGSDVLVFDRETRATTRVSVDSQGHDLDGYSSHPALSADGRYVAFQFLPDLLSVDGNRKSDVLVFDRETRATTKVRVDPQSSELHGYSSHPALSANGRFVAFESWILHPKSENGNRVAKIFVVDRELKTTTQVSLDPQGGDLNWLSYNPTLSADGRFVAYESWTQNIGLGELRRKNSILVFDRKTEATMRVSVDSQGRDLDGFSFDPTLSTDGRYVAFDSWAGNPGVGDGNGDYDVFIRDRGPAVIGPPGVRDLDGTGTADLLWRNTYSGEVAVWLMEGARMGASSTLGGVPQEWQIAGSGDVDGNGTADIIWRNMTSGVVAIWMMKGSRISSIGFPGSASMDWVIKGVGDFDGNEKVDIFWRNAKSGQVSVWLMEGATIVSTGLFHALPSEEKIAGIGDVNADGKADVFWLNTRTGKVTIWQMDGLTIGFVGFPGSTALDWDIQGVGDLDGNGTADVLWRQRRSGVVAAWLLMGSTISSSGFFKGVPAAWTLAQIGDVDGNGTADVIWHNRINGTVAVWMMNGLGISSVGYPGKVASEWVLADH